MIRHSNLLIDDAPMKHSASIGAKLETIETARAGVKPRLSIIVQPHRLQNPLKDVLIVVGIALWSDGYQIKQIAVPQLGRHHVDYLRASRGFVDVAQRNRAFVATVDVSALIIPSRAQVVVALLQAVDKLVGGLLQVAAVRSG